MTTSPSVATKTHTAGRNSPVFPASDDRSFVRELKGYSQDPARYLQRCIAMCTGARNAHADSTPSGMQYAPSARTLRNISVTKRSFLAEKPDYGMITDMITSYAPGNYYISPQTSRITAQWERGNWGYHYLTTTGAEQYATPQTPENKDISIDTLQSTMSSEKKRTSSNRTSKKRKRKRKIFLKKNVSHSHKKQLVNQTSSKRKKEVDSFAIKGKKVEKLSEISSKAVKKILLQIPSPGNRAGRHPLSQKKNGVINKLLEETEEMLRITFLSNTRLSPTGKDLTVPLLQNQNISGLLNNVASKIVHSIRNMSVSHNQHESTSTNTPTMSPRKSTMSVKKGPTSCRSSTSSFLSKTKEQNSDNERRCYLGEEKSMKASSSDRMKKRKLSSIVLGRPGKDDTEEAELSHCVIYPDPPSALSEPYIESNSSLQASFKSLPQEPVECLTPDLKDEKVTYASKYIRPFTDSNKSELLNQNYNSQISYVCTNTQLNLQGMKTESSADAATVGISGKVNSPRKESSGNKKDSLASSTSNKKPIEEQKCVATKSLTKKTAVKANISEAARKISHQTLEVKRLLPQGITSDSENKLRANAVRLEKSSSLRANNRQIFKAQPERRPRKNIDTRPYTSSSDTSRGSRYLLHQRQSRWLHRTEDIRTRANATAERRFFNKTDHLMFLSRPTSRYVEETKKCYRSVLDPYHVRNLDTIIYCNHVENQRLK